MISGPGIPIESPGVNVAVVKKDLEGWKFLLLKRAYHESYAGSWGLLTGTKHGDETVTQLALREIKEETGLTPKALWATEHIIQFYEPEEDAIWILPLVVAVVSQRSEVVLSPENEEFVWLEASTARKQVFWKNLVRAIDQICEELQSYPAPTWLPLQLQ
ncbi:MAG: NUDIX domain-containing protein [Candidatus Zixiibacteriota bacterium]